MARGTTGRRSTGPTGLAGQAAVKGVNQLNQAQCGRGVGTDCYLNRQTRGAVGRLHPATGGGGKLSWPAGGLYWGAKPGPGGVVGAAALPGQGGHAGGAGGQGWWRPDQP